MGGGQSFVRPFLVQRDMGDITRELEAFRSITAFSNRDLILLGQRYKDLTGCNDLLGEGRFSELEFIKAMNVSNERIGRLIYRMIDSDGNGNINFTEFVTALSTFLPTSPIQTKIDAVFRAMDRDGGGAIERDEVREMLLAALENNSLIELPGEDIDELVDEIFGGFSTPDSGALSKKQFEAMLRSCPALISVFEFDIAEASR
jgi:serine/threonine-protein phosphatase 2B regulatory subunit